MARDILRRLRSFQENPNVAQLLEFEDMKKLVASMTQEQLKIALKRFRSEADVYAQEVAEDIRKELREVITEFLEEDGVAFYKGDQGEKGEPGDPGEPGMDGVDGKDGKDGEDGKDGKTPVKGKDYFTKEEISDVADAAEKRITKEVIKERIEQLPVRTPWFDWGHIKNVPSWVKDKTGSGPRMGRGTGSSVLAADLSSQCDGNTTTFTVPSHTRALMLVSTQFPHTYRPTTDYTTSGTSLSLTSEVGAPQSGQTLIFLYVE